MSRTIRCVKDHLVVQRTREYKLGSILLPPSAKHVLHPTEGIVLNAGPGKRTDQGELIPMNAKIGDTIIYGRYSGVDVIIDGQEVLIIRDVDVMAIIEPEPEG